MKICALVIGHKKTSPGATNKTSGLSEFAFNETLAFEIESLVKNVVVQKIYRRTYSTLPSDINELNPDFIVSLHCNAKDSVASGTETLYYHRSVNGKRIARILNGHLVNALRLKDRGIKPKTSEDRGGHLLKGTVAPCIIGEPFFIDNDNDLQVALHNKNALIAAYSNAIQEIASII